MENKPQTMNKMGTMPVGKLILNMSLPIMFSMLILALYNIVDSIFVAMINEEAFTALSLAFPIQNLITSFSVGTSIGVNAVLSRRLGEQNQEAVNKSAVNGLFLAVCTAVVFCILGYFLITPYLQSQASNPVIVEYGIEYMHIVVFCSVIPLLGIMSDKLLQSTGRTFYTMITQISAAVTNIILDPIMIFGLGPVPEMGVYGAAIATVIGQIVGLVLSLFFNVKKNPDVQIKIKGFRPDLKIIGEIYKIGIPSIILSSITSVTAYFLNLILGAFTSTAIAVYGSFIKLNSFVFMPVFGLNGGIVPIVAYNYGARNKERIQKAIKIGITMALVIMIAGVAVFELIPGILLKLFSASDSMLEIGKPALRIIAPSFIGAAIAICLSSVFQAFGKAMYSMTISLIRQLAVLLPAAYLLSLAGNLNLVWFSFLIAEVASISFSLFYLARINRKIISKL